MIHAQWYIEFWYNKVISLVAYHRWVVVRYSWGRYWWGKTVISHSNQLNIIYHVRDGRWKIE